MIIQVRKDKVATELSQVVVKLLESANPTFPFGVVNEGLYTEEAKQKYNEIYDLVDNILDEATVEIAQNKTHESSESNTG